MTNMHKQLISLIDAAPEENQGAFEGQVLLKYGNGHAGAIKKSDMEGIFEVVSIGRMPDGTEVPTISWFEGDDVVQISRITAVSKPTIITPNDKKPGSSIITGL